MWVLFFEGGNYITAFDMGEEESDPELREFHELRARLKPQLSHEHQHGGSDQSGHRGMGSLRRRDFGRAWDILCIVVGGLA